MSASYLFSASRIMAAHKSGGFGRLHGTAEANDNPASCPVELYVEIAGPLKSPARSSVVKVKISETKSNASGAWEFRHLSQANRYTVISYDPTGEFDPVIKGGLIPSPMQGDES